jgi:transforming growth factor-beta-induced protein
MSKKLMSILLVLIVALSMTTYAQDQSIVEIAVSIDDFSILVAALQQAELVGALSGDGPFTVFAPTNAAFVKLLGDLNITAEQLLAHPQLSEVLLYHVVSGNILSTDLSNGLKAATLNGEEITVDLTSGVKINSSSVTTADVIAKNGVIHIIDTVLVPASFTLETKPDTVVDIALSSPDFSMLVSLLQKADLVGALQSEGPFTVFAPTNDAFNKLLAALNISASDLMNQPDLAKVLLYHVVSGNVLSTDLSNGLSASTLNGESVSFNLTDGVKVQNASVVLADLVAKNGVVHVIDSVLVPQNFVYQAVIQDTQIPQTGTLNIGLLALTGLMTLTGATYFKKRNK